jgi:alpha-1,2-mannosyltransferase
VKGRNPAKAHKQTVPVPQIAPTRATLAAWVDKRDASVPLPSLKEFAAALLVVRLYAAMTLPISDCDETFNYWEPVHQLMYGRGFQTWEYR